MHKNILNRSIKTYFIDQEKRKEQIHKTYLTDL